VSTELRFHREIYPGEHVDEAAKRFEKYAQLARREDGEHWVIEVTAKTPARERQVAGELGNWALGLVVQKRGGR
jgi:hypothetical protein